jgi:hypothetical protein
MGTVVQSTSSELLKTSAQSRWRTNVQFIRVSVLAYVDALWCCRQYVKSKHALQHEIVIDEVVMDLFLRDLGNYSLRMFLTTHIICHDSVLVRFSHVW